MGLCGSFWLISYDQHSESSCFTHIHLSYFVGTDAITFMVPRSYAIKTVFNVRHLRFLMGFIFDKTNNIINLMFENSTSFANSIGQAIYKTTM